MRVALAILAGFLTMSLPVFLSDLAWVLFTDYEPGTDPGPTYFAIQETVGLAAAVAGGYVATRLGRRRWAAPLGLVVFAWLMGYVFMVGAGGQVPLLWSLLHFATMLVGVAFGAWLHLRSAKPAELTV